MPKDLNNQQSWKACCMGVDEYKQAKIFINMLTFLQFLLHIPMWCHFNGMLIMESCVY
jgi:hypothetical protein